MGDVALAAIAEITLLKKDWNEAIVQAQQTLKVAQVTGATWSAAIAYRVWGQALVNLDSPTWDEAEKLFADSLSTLESGKNRLEAARTLIAWGEACRDRGNTATAPTYWEQANRQFTESDSTQEIRKVQELMVGAEHRAEGREQSAKGEKIEVEKVSG